MAAASQGAAAYIRTRRLVGCGFRVPSGASEPFGNGTTEDMGTRLFVGNLSFDADKNTLRDAFAEIGAITDVHIVLERERGRSRGFAFVTMASTEIAKEAIARLDGAELGGRALRVKAAPQRSAVL